MKVLIYTILLLQLSYVEARVYKCIDKDGKVSYNNSSSGCGSNYPGKEEVFKLKPNEPNVLTNEHLKIMHEIEIMNVASPKEAENHVIKHNASHGYPSINSSIDEFDETIREVEPEYNSGLEHLKRISDSNDELFKKKQELRRIENRPVFSDIDRQQQSFDWNRKNKEIIFH